MAGRPAKLILTATVAFLVAIASLGYFWARNYLFDKALAALKSDEYAEAATTLEWVAYMGDSNAQRLMGDLYALGWGVSKNDEEAIKWYRRAGPIGETARDPAAPAMYYIGREYLGGKGVPRNDFEARKWLERSAQGGYAKALDQLAHSPPPSGKVSLEFVSISGSNAEFRLVNGTSSAIGIVDAHSLVPGSDFSVVCNNMIANNSPSEQGWGERDVLFPGESMQVKFSTEQVCPVLFS